jgi:hypothetical protein
MLLTAAREAAETEFWLGPAVDEHLAARNCEHLKAGIRKAGNDDPQFMEGVAEAIVRFLS